MPVHVRCRVVTLWQPWATAVAMGLKTIETRNWGTRYRGLLGIHAGRRWDEHAAQFLPAAAVARARDERGVLLALAMLEDVVKFDSLAAWKEAAGSHLCPMDYWQPGKAGWLLNDIRPIKPVAVRGAQGLWIFDGDVEYVEAA